MEYLIFKNILLLNMLKAFFWGGGEYKKKTKRLVT